MKIRKKKPGLGIIALLAALSVFLSFVYFRIFYPVIKNYAVSCAETVMLNSANEAIVRVLRNRNVTYKDIVNLSDNSDGYITSLEIDVVQVNSFKSLIASEISDIIAEKEKYDFSVPIGSFFGNSFLNGYGPDIKFKMQISTTAYVDFSHVFKSAGINQVLHIINVDISINGMFIVSGFRKSVNVKTSAIAAQTVIVGKSPDAFTNVIESNLSDTGGLINDYGAQVDIH